MSSYKVGTRVKRLEGPYKPEKYEEMTDKPIFYVIQPTICDDFNLIKIGKAQNPKVRFGSYARHYDGMFKVIRFIEFRKLSNDLNIDGASDFASKFETQIKKALTAKKINSIRGYEFYTQDQLDDILQTMGEIDKLNKASASVIADNRRSLRDLKPTDKRWEVEKITGKRTVNGVVQYKVKWKGYVKQNYEPARLMRADVPLMVKAYEDSVI